MHLYMQNIFARNYEIKTNTAEKFPSLVTEEKNITQLLNYNVNNVKVINPNNKEETYQKSAFVYKDTGALENRFNYDRNDRRMYHTTSLYKNKTPAQMYGSINFNRRYNTLKYKTSSTLKISLLRKFKIRK